jgi:hypothetical protein
LEAESGPESQQASGPEMKNERSIPAGRRPGLPAGK